MRPEATEVSSTGIGNISFNLAGSESTAASADVPDPAPGFGATNVRKARVAHSHADRGGR